MTSGAPLPIAATRNDEAASRFVGALGALRRSTVAAGRALVEIDRCGHFLHEGCASIGEFGERHGASATEARQLLALGRALDANPALEERVLDGRIPIQSGALLDRVFSDAALVRAGDDWLGWAESESTKRLRRRIDRRCEEARTDDGYVVGITIFVTFAGRDAFARARVIASRRADRPMTDGQTLEAVVDHYLDSFDDSRTRPGSRRLPHTASVHSRYVPADVRRTLCARDGDACAVPFCDHEIFLQNAHLVAHAVGGDREADNLVRLCAKHHKMLDEGRLRILGGAEDPRFVDADGRLLDGRAANLRRHPTAPT